MELTIKQLKQGGQVFVPQTTAEAVLVKDQTEVLTLDKVLDKIGFPTNWKNIVDL